MGKRVLTCIMAFVLVFTPMQAFAQDEVGGEDSENILWENDEENLNVDDVESEIGQEEDESVESGEESGLASEEEGTDNIQIVNETDNLEETDSLKDDAKIQEEDITLRYRAHVQTVGWQGWISDGKAAGTSGKSLRMEAFVIDLGDTKWNNQIEYRAHVQNIGWQKWVHGGENAGTTGKSLRVEAIEIRLTGELAEKYDIYYTTHVSYLGDLDWVCNGGSAGTQGLAQRMEAMKIRLVKKGAGDAPVCGNRGFRRAFASSALTYAAHVQKQGDLEAVCNGQIQGTVGKSLRMEGISISLDTTQPDTFDGGITYRTHVQNIGWQDWKKDGEFAGTKGKSLQIEAIQIKLTGEVEKYYNIYYRTHIQNFGWMGWAMNGQKAGSEKIAQRVEAVQVVIVPKNMGQSTYKNSGISFRDTYVYQNPLEYLQIRHKQKVLSGGGYNLSSGYMGLKVAYVQRKLGLGVRRAIMDSSTIEAVKSFQRRNGLSATGVVDLTTWKKMGFSENDWYNLGTYASPLKTNPSSTRQQCIEAMISTAYSYLGTEYIIGAAGRPGTGADCSGLVMQALYSAGIDVEPVSPIRHSRPGYEYESRNLWTLPMKHVSYSQRQRGDLIFYSNASGTIIHVAIYLGNDQVIEAWPTKVVVWPIKNSHRSIIKGVVRPFV